MKNAIKILLYLLLALLVIAIAVIVYKRSKTPTDDVPTTSEMADSLFMDPQTDQTALTAEDSMILDMTGQLPTHVGAPITDVSKSQGPPSDEQAVNTNIDYSKPVENTEHTAAVNTNPKAQKVSNTAAKPKVETAVEKKAEAKPIVKPANKPVAAKPVANKSAGFYVVSGSFIVPGHADAQVKKLKKLGYKGASKKVFGSSEYYSAVAGLYNDRKEAEKEMNKLLAKGEKAFLKAK